MLKAGELNIYIDESGAMRPADNESHKRLKRIKKSCAYSFKYKRIRNYEFHKKYFAMLNLAFKNQSTFIDFDWFREHTLLGVKWCDSLIVDNVLCYKVKSINFDKCTAEEFEIIYQKTLSFLMVKYGFDENFVDRLLNFS
jgi:hypothetical protein